MKLLCVGPNGVFIYQEGKQLRAHSACCDTRITWTSGMPGNFSPPHKWYCSSCEAQVIWVTVYWASAITIGETRWALEEWIAGWFEIEPGQVRVSVEM